VTSRGALVLIAIAAGAFGWASSSSPAAPRRLEVRVLRFVDHTRTIGLPGGRRVPRAVTTIVRYPASGGPDPLIVFAHGFAVTPATYAPLLRAWADAGYVVAAPVFPLTNANAPGGPNESDLPNQPADVRLVITRLLELAAQPHGEFRGRIDPRRIAVAGQSDGGLTALAVAYESHVRDPRIRAAVILSGAEPAGMGAFPRRGPALLAMQGTADQTNLPENTVAYFDLAPRPKFLVMLEGASHLPPYTSEEPQLQLVERITLAFLDHYFKQTPLGRLIVAGRHPGLSSLVART
jgi:acetyl esterase/lipase